jgi:hypothetical protein
LLHLFWSNHHDMGVNQHFLDRKCWSYLLPNYPI